MVSRTDKLRKLFLRTLSSLILKEVKDPRVKNVTITDVDISKDIKHCRVYVETFGGDINQVLEGLNKASGFLQCRAGKVLKLKNTPRLLFLKDKSFDYAQKINKIIEKEKNESIKTNS